MTPIFYDPRQSIDSIKSYSKSASKPRRFVELMQHFAYHNYGPQSLGTVVPVTKKDLCLVHSKDYIHDLFALRVPNGFGDCNPDLPESCLWTVGCLLSAARHAMKYPAIPVCAPVSGFHHSGYDEAAGFCTVNGLIIVAAKLIQENPNIRIGIIDADAHYGDGSAALLKRHKHIGKQVLHFTSGQHFYGNEKQEDALDFQAWLHSAIKETNAFNPDLVLYQAGADAWEHDDLGSGYLSKEQLAQRDRDVFRGIKAPVAWVLAGGYAKSSDGTIFTDPVLDIHHNTLRESDASVSFRKEQL